MTERRVTIHAPAKINVSLRVMGTRLDGYHDVRTTLQSLALCDTLTVTPARGGLALECDDPRCPSDSSNLVWKAAAALWRFAKRPGRPANVHIRIEKRIPMQAGLGGGSSDAAAALRALAPLWRVAISRQDLLGLAGTLGSDVPFFLEGGTALGLDRGDELFPLVDRPPSWVVLVLPDFGVSTPEAYRWWDADTTGRTSRRRVVNDLQASVAMRHPSISRVVGRLTRLGASLAAMSGSGSAVFGLFDAERLARAAADAIESNRSRVLVTRTVSRRQYERLSRPR